MKKIFLITLSLLAFSIVTAKEYVLNSPDGKISINVSVKDTVKYSVGFNNARILSPSEISLHLAGRNPFGIKARVKKATTNSVSEILFPVVARKYAQIHNDYNELKLRFTENYQLTFRAYNDGVAYRWSTTLKDSITVVDEVATFNFENDHSIWFPEEESMFSHQEREYKYISLSTISPDRFCSTGTLIDLGNGNKVYISESDLLDYPGMFLRGMSDNPYGLQGKFAGYPLETEQKNDRSVPVTDHADFLAKTNGTRDFPWRVMIVSEKDSDLVESDLIWKLATPNKLEDASWIKSGKVAWDWWNDLNIYGVDFESGVNTETYKYFIDFAHDYGLDFIILDEGWYHLEDVLKVKEKVDVPEIIEYGRQKGIGIILWVTWKALYDNLDEALQQFEAWGVKGIKVDFMQRDDQWMVIYYEEIAAEAAAHKLLVDFHGAYKPTGLHRTYPNVITFEGVAGLEHNKWSIRTSPEHDLTLPFIRMVAGPMDYTPGAMINANKESFRAVWSEPMSQGTRCHQLAMYVVFESPLQMLADNPSNYRNQPECMEFLSEVPTVWDDTKVLEASVSDYILVARKSKDRWFIGGMTDWDKRTMKINFDFLDKGEYRIFIWQDGINANRHASDFKKIEKKINNETTLEINMAPGGGWAAIIESLK